MKEGSRIRAAVTLVELVVFLAIGSVVFLILGQFFQSGSSLFVLVGRQVSVTGDARATIENLTADIHAAFHVERPRVADDWSRERTLLLYRFAGADPRRRVERNIADAAAAAYPHHGDARETVQYMDVQKVTYKLEPSSGQEGLRVTRHEEGGYLRRAIDAGSGLPTHAFNADPRVKARSPGTAQLATHVKLLEIVPVALVEDASRNRRQLIKLGEDGTTPEQIVMILIRYAADQQPVSQRIPGGTIELSTKVWIDRKAYELRFPEFFSSVDENLAF